MIHSWRKDRKHEASSHTQNLRRHRSRSSKAAAENGRSNTRHDPVKLYLGRPAVPEKADRDEQTAWNHERNAIFGRSCTVGLLHSSPEAICDRCSNLVGETVADGESEVMVPTLGDGLMVLVFEKRGEG